MNDPSEPSWEHAILEPSGLQYRLLCDGVMPLQPGSDLPDMSRIVAFGRGRVVQSYIGKVRCAQCRNVLREVAFTEVRLKPIIALLMEWTNKWEDMKGPINEACMMAGVHGYRYAGPTIGDLSERTKAALMNI